MAKKKSNNFSFYEEKSVKPVEVAAEPEEAAVVIEEKPTIVEKTVNRYINVRKAPTLSSEKVGTLNPGEKVKVYGVEGEWSCISKNNDKYVRSIRLD